MKISTVPALLTIVNLCGAFNLGSIIGAFRGDRGCPSVTSNRCPADISYWLYTRSNRKGTRLNERSLHRAGFSRGPLKIIIHGYWNNKNSPINTDLRNAYFGYGDYNIISVDWSRYTKGGCYYSAVASVPSVGRCVGQFLSVVLRAHRFSGVHLLGHSLGAHVGATASASVSPRLDRLTKLDPAGPLFSGTDEGSAGFVDVYHTNAGFLGQSQTSGDVDVYFNNGAFQPGCKCDVSCSHMRAFQYFAEGISKGMKGFSCAGWTEYTGYHCHLPTLRSLVTLGEEVSTTTRGTYMVFTNPKAPFLIKDSAYTSKNSFYSFQKSAALSCKAGEVISIIKDIEG